MAAEVAQAVQAVERLGTVLREVVSYFGREVPADTIMSWTGDDCRL